MGDRLADQKIKITASLTERQVSYVDAKAKKEHISFGDSLRRLVDAQIADEERRAQPPRERIVVLDRDKNTLTGAR